MIPGLVWVQAPTGGRWHVAGEPIAGWAKNSVADLPSGVITICGYSISSKRPVQERADRESYGRCCQSCARFILAGKVATDEAAHVPLRIRAR